MTISLSDVAERANASLATVSRVLGGSKHPVASAMRARVLEAAKELGYVPDPIARALVTRMTNVIGVIVGDVADTYFAEIARGVEDVARAHGYLTIVCSADRSPAAETAYFGMLLEHRAAGIVFAGGSYVNVPEARILAKALERTEGTRTRVMCLADRGFDAVPVVSVDNRAVLSDLTRHLISFGHKRIAYVEGPEGFSTSLQRAEGFADVMREAGLDGSLRFNGGFGIESGRIAATAMLSGELPDAVIAASDETAIGVMVTLRQAGIDVPRRVSVAGVDDVKFAQLMDLTTARLPTYELGAMAARQILGQEWPKTPSRTILSHRIVLRGSVAWAARAVESGGSERSPEPPDTPSAASAFGSGEHSSM